MSFGGGTFGGVAFAQSDADSSLSSQSHRAETDPDVDSPKAWANRILEFLPKTNTSMLVEVSRLSMDDYRTASPKELRHAAQDILAERLDLNIADITKFLSDSAAESQDVHRELAALYALSGKLQPEDNLNVFDSYLLSESWFVVVSAEVEIARQLNFRQDFEGAEKAVRRALLKIPETGKPEFVEEAHYNIAIIAQVLAMNASDLETAYSASQALLNMSIAQKRVIDRHTIVFNLAQLHGATFGWVETGAITRSLLDYSMTLDDKRTLLGLYLYGVTLFESGKFAESIPYFSRALDIINVVEDTRFEESILQFQVRALSEDGQVQEAQKLFARLEELERQLGPSLSGNIAKARLLAAQGKTLEAYELEAQTSAQVLLMFSKSLLRPSKILRMDSAVFTAPETNPRERLALSLSEFGSSADPGRAVTEGLDADTFRALRALEVELKVFSDAEPDSDDQWLAAALDAVFGRSGTEPRRAVPNYRQNLVGDDPERLELANLFDRYLVASEAGEDVPPPTDGASDALAAWTWLLRSRLALEQGDSAVAYRALEEARYLTLREPDVAARLRYDLSDQDLSLAALEGNPVIAAAAALSHAEAARESGRADPLFVAMSGTISALERAGHLREALALSDTFYALSESRDEPSVAFAAYTKGRLLYLLGRNERAVMFLSAARDGLSDPELEPLIYRALYPSSAGAGRAEDAAAASKQLRQLLARRNDTELYETSAPYIAHGDALYAEAREADPATTVSLWKAWTEARTVADALQWQTQSELATQRADATLGVLASEAESNRDFAEQLAGRRAATDGLRILLILSALAFLAGLGFLLFRLRQLGRQQKLSSQASVIKGQFLNMIGHEARVRLQGISSFADSLKSSSISLEHLPTVQVIGNQANSLGQAISDLIASARILSGDSPTRQDVFIAEDLRSRVLDIAPELIGRRDISFSFDIAPNVTPVLVERHYVNTAIERLVRVAVRNTRAGTVNVRLSLENTLRGPCLNIVVEDTGSGMTPGEIDNLMAAFEHDVAGVSRVMTTEALDLPLAHQAVLALGGTMQVRSEVGEGTRVTMSIPVKRAAANDMSDTRLGLNASI